MKRTLIGIVLSYLFAAVTMAAPVAGQVTLTMTQTTRTDGKVDVSLSWSTAPSADGCVSTGAWTGSRGSSRSVSSPLKILAVTAPADFTLTCRWDDKDVVLTWVPPTKNVDNTNIVPPIGFRIYYGTAPTTLTTIVDVPPATPATATKTIGNLAAGVYHFAMTALTTGGESVKSGTVSATLGSATSAATRTATSAISKPAEPTSLVATP